MHGIVGQKRPNVSDDVLARDTAARDALLTLATGHTDELWEPVTPEPPTKGLGDMPYYATSHAQAVLDTFDGVARP